MVENEDYEPTTLEEEITSEIDALQNIPVGSPESKVAVENVATLIKAQNEICQGNAEYEQNERRLQMEEENGELNKKAAKLDLIKFIVGTLTSIGTTALGFGLYGKWYHEGLHHDDSDIVSGPTAKDLIRNKPNPFRMKK